jgi:hypothetical protein
MHTYANKRKKATLLLPLRDEPRCMVTSVRTRVRQSDSSGSRAIGVSLLSIAIVCLGYGFVVAQTDPVPAVSNTVTAVAQSVTTAEDTPVAITLTGSDVDGDALTFTIVTEPANSALSGPPP